MKNMQKYECNFGKIIRCGNEIYREDKSDYFDFPYCEDCQLKSHFCEDCQEILNTQQITRLDDGRHI